MLRIFENIKQNQFAKNVSVLASGTIIVQGISILLSPVLSRLYTPEDYGLLAVFISCISVLIVIGSFRYELAILIPKEAAEANALLILSIGINIIFAAVIFLLTIIFNSSFSILLGNEKISFWLYFIAPVFLASGISQSLTSWYNRNKNYKLISGVRIYQSSINSVFSLGLGFLKFNSVGLIVSQIASQILSSLYIVKRSALSLRKFSFSIPELKQAAKKHIEFPAYSLPSALLDVFSINSIIFLLNHFFSEAVTGAYSFSLRILTLPTVLIGAAIGQVFYQKISEAHSNNEKITSSIYKTWKVLFLLGIVPAIIIFFFGEQLFSIVFGSKWIQAGEISRYVCILTLVNFVSSPTSSAMIVLKKQKIVLIVNVITFVYRPLAILWGYYTDNFLNGIILFVILEITQVVLYNVVLIRSSINADSNLITKN
ncbi:MAG: oligosaccharide flippase family protein [bacterium]